MLSDSQNGAGERVLPRRRVRVWFGEHVIAEKLCSTSAAAARYEAGMQRRFQSLRVTNDLVQKPRGVQ